jgi:hypothetical protein
MILQPLTGLFRLTPMAGREAARLKDVVARGMIAPTYG